MRKSGARNQRIILSLAVLAIATGCAFGKYGGGTGEPNDPYRIASAEDLLTLAADINDYNAHFILTADIDLDPNLPGGRIFTIAVIAPDTNNSNNFFDGAPFTGIFDGAGHKIINLTIDTNGLGNDCLGLFGCVDSNAGGAIKKLGLEKVSIRGGSGSYYLGGLVGYNDNGSISNCLATGNIRGGNNSDSIGGLVGDNYYGSISNCFSGCDVNGGDCSSNLGGLAGGNIGTINECRSAGIVTGGIVSMWLGGLAGSNNGTISNCYSAGTVTGGEYSYNLGDLVGDNPNGTIINCHSTNTVEAMILNNRSFMIARK